MVYGITEDSDYIDRFLPQSDSEVIVSNGYLEKYGLKVGDTILLCQKYSEKEYSFIISGTYDYPASMSVFVGQENFNRILDKEPEYFSGYFSNQKITDIEDNMIASTITQHDLTIITDQLEDSMGMMFPMFGGFSVLLYLLIIYLLSKIIKVSCFLGQNN